MTVAAMLARLTYINLIAGSAPRGPLGDKTLHGVRDHGGLLSTHGRVAGLVGKISPLPAGRVP